MSRRYAKSCVHVALACSVWPASAYAEGEAPPPPQESDATFGRIAGDVGIVAGAGATIGPRDARGMIDLRVRYLDTAGIFVSYEDGKIFGDGAEPVRVLASGVELRPLFLGRWLTGRELGNARLDLAIDSLGIELGGFAEQPSGKSFGSRPGLQAGIGFEVPIFASASGPWIGAHAGVRWADSSLGGDAVRSPSDRAAYLAITLAWHQIFGAHVVDLRDAAPR